MKIFFSGGGTLGSVTPLLGIRDALSHEYPDAEYVWVGTKHGPERAYLAREAMRYIFLSAGKFRRYLSFKNIVDFVRVIHGFFTSLFLLHRERPDACVSAGGFVSVPLHWAAWCLKIPTWIHQQDAQPGLANRLMAPCATVITIALKSNLPYFSPCKTKFLGNPVRSFIFQGDKKEGERFFHLRPGCPVVLVLGGGTGAARVNELLVDALPLFADAYDIIHLYGKDRPPEKIFAAQKKYICYHPYPFLQDEISHAYAVADIVVGRAGLGTLTELAALSKPVVLIPKHGHQEENATALKQRSAVLVLDEQETDGNTFAHHIQELFQETYRREELGRRLHECIHVPTSSEIKEIYQALVA